MRWYNRKESQKEMVGYEMDQKIDSSQSPKSERDHYIYVKSIKKKKTVKVKKVDLAERIITLVEEAKRKVVSAVNVALVYTYYEVGRMIVEEEQGGRKRAQYGKAQLQELSQKLTAQLGKGWSVENLTLMRKLFVVYSQEIPNSVLEIPSDSVNPVYPIDEAMKTSQSKIVNGVYEIKKAPYPFRLSWSHYLVLMRIDNPDERRFYEIEAAENGWDLDELTHQDIGQMQMYVNYYDRKVKMPEENPTIGILLCADKNDAIVEMTLPQGPKRIFASKYMTVLPDKETLRSLVRKQLGTTT